LPAGGDDDGKIAPRSHAFGRESAPRYDPFRSEHKKPEAAASTFDGMAEPHVLSALREKRAELSGELIGAENRTARLRADLESLDGALRVVNTRRIMAETRFWCDRRESGLSAGDIR
jgi:hypothetical protein